MNTPQSPQSLQKASAAISLPAIAYPRNSEIEIRELSSTGLFVSFVLELALVFRIVFPHIHAASPVVLLALRVLFMAAIYGHLRWMVRRNTTGVSVRDGFVRHVSRTGKVLVEVDLRKVESYKFGLPLNGYWLRLVTKDDRYDIGRSGPDVFSRAHARRAISRAMHPYLAHTVERPNDSANELLRYAQLKDFAPLEVAMQPGVVYRYRAPKEFGAFAQRFAWRTKFFKNVHPAIFPFVGLGVIFSHGPWANHTFFYALVGVFITVAAAAMVSDRIPNFTEALHDRFELVPEGLRVSRNGKTWIVTDPQPAIGIDGSLSILDAPIVRFGKGDQAYYFDPRFIEPEETALQRP